MDSSIEQESLILDKNYIYYFAPQNHCIMDKNAKQSSFQLTDAT